MIQRIAWLAAIGLFFVCAAGIASLGSVWNSNMKAPVQPVAFSHVRHALQNELACTHCHQYADRSRHATVPAMSICAECHGQMETQNPQVQKLQKFLKEGKPVEWIKVHNLPWHVYFTHKRHIKASVECRTCHGDVEAMPRVRQLRSLHMGWCVACHRLRQAPTDCWTCHK